MWAILISSMLSTAPSGIDPSIPLVATIDDVPGAEVQVMPECWVDIEAVGKAPENGEPDFVPALVQRADGGLLFPEDATRIVLWRLRCLERWPEIAQVKLDELKAVDLAKLEQQDRLIEMLENEAKIEEEVPDRTEVLLLVAVAAGVGFLAGGAAVYLLQR